MIVCVDPGHQNQTEIETVRQAPNFQKTVTTQPGMARGRVSNRRESIVTLEIGLMLRNALLKEIAKNPSLAPTLDMWDEQLALVGAQIAQNRREAIERLSQDAKEAHASLTDGREELRLWYISQTAESGDVAGQLLARLHAARAEDMRRMTTTVGIHRDDIGVTINGKEARTFASQGQQRSAVLSLKLAQLEMAARETGEAPILMLDDVMSELDPGRRRQLIERIDRVQTFVTCTDLSDLAGARQGAVYHVESGVLKG